MISILKIIFFLQISQDLDRVTHSSINSFLLIMKFWQIWYESLIFKLRQIGLSGDINILRDFLPNRKQSVVSNG